MNDTPQNVRVLRTADSEPDADTVEILETALAMAKDGRLRTVALAGTVTGSRTYSAYATNDLQEAIGLTSFLHFTLCVRLREGSEEV